MEILGLLTFRKDRALERLLDGRPVDEAVAHLEGVLQKRPDHCRAAALLARAQAERGDFDRALQAADRAASGFLPAAARVLRSEVLLAAGRLAEGRSALEDALSLEPENLTAQGLLGVLEIEEGGMRDVRRRIEALPPGAIWCGSVLARLHYIIEVELERRSAAGATAAFHEARTVLFRPKFGPDVFPRFWMEGLFDGLRKPEARVRAVRERSLRAALRAEDLGRAEGIVEEARKDGPPGLERFLLAGMEIAFVRDNHSRVRELHKDWLDALCDASDPYPAALAAYACLAEGKAQRAIEILSGFRRQTSPEAEIFHLSAIAELKLGKPSRAAAEIRRAAARNDISMVQLAKEEAAWIDGGAPPDPNETGGGTRKLGS